MTEHLVTELLNSQAELNPHKIAIIYKGNHYSYSFLNSWANRVCQWLRQSGVKPGDRVALYGINSEKFIIALFGVLKSGAVFVPIHHETSQLNLEFILNDCTPTAIILDANLLPFLGTATTRVHSILQMSNDPDFYEPRGIVTQWNELNSYQDFSSSDYTSPDSLAIVIYTSGSTKEPRGVMEPHRQVLFATSAINKVIGNTAEDRILCGLPFSFDYGLYQIFLTFQVGATLVLEADFSFPLAIPRILNSNRVTGLPGVPTVFALLLQSRLLERIELPYLRYITSTGDVFPVAHIERLQELIPHVTIFPMYGLTECKRVSIVPKGELDSHRSSVGRPLPGVQVRIINEEGQEVPDGIVGQLAIRGPNIMAGYWNNPEETRGRFVIEQGKTELLSGDYFYKDSDDFLYFVGRSETIIKSRGQKISTVEIESFLCTIKGVTEAAVFGIPDSIVGELVCAYVYSTDPQLNPAIITERCRLHLSPSALPEYVFVVDSPLPKTLNGKINHKKLFNDTAMKLSIANTIND